MPLTKKNQEIFEKLRRRHRIKFQPELPGDKWPEGHRKVLEAIETAKTFRYNTYQVDREENVTKPWKNDAKRQARKLVEKSKDCVSRNEATWRLACESLVFSRLAAEVACQTCRQRVWRSEIESSLGENNRASSSLKRRQEARERCRCPMSSRPDGEEEMVGLNKLFIDRADDLVVHPQDLAEQLPQDQRPDRVYGLRQTRNFDELLLKKVGNGIFIEDRLQEQPHSTAGQALLFPFMVVEAKAGNAADEWHDIKLQTAFPIYTYLKAQQSIRNATGPRCRWDSGPLVWFFASRGDDWRLFLAYNQYGAEASESQSPGEDQTIIVPVWTGCVSNHDAALQLFLIVDFIADWARDVYRASILTELRILSAPARDVSTVASETFVFSTRSVHGYGRAEEDAFEVPQHHRNDLQDVFKELDTSFGAVRHVAPIESRFRALFITEDNVQTLLSSLEKNDRELFLKRILSRFDRPQYSLSLTGDNIAAVEEAWTGNTRLRTPFNIRGTKLSTLLVVTYHLSPAWEQIRELCLVSITDKAFEIISAESKLKNLPLPVKSEGDFTWVVEKVAQLKGLSSADNLSCCISRVCVYLDSYSESAVVSRYLSRFEKCDATVWELVNYIYKQHKRGDLEPDLPFLRLSTMADMQIKAENGPATFSRPLVMDQQLRWSRDSAVLVHGSLHRPYDARGVSSICVFLNEFYKEPPDGPNLAKIIATTFQDRDVYHTTRDNGSLKLRTWNNYRDIWNLKNTYGVFFSYGDASFSKWLQNLDSPSPSRQGSPRGPFDTGRSMFERKYNPWQDPRLASNQSRPILRKKFVTELIMAEALEWARLARESRLLGNSCCCLCGGELEDGDDEPEFLYEVNAEGVSFDPSCVPKLEHSESCGSSSSALYNLRPRLKEKTPKDRFENLCAVCTDHMFQESHWGTGWQDWMKEVLRTALWKIVSEDTAEPEPVDGPSPHKYCISTPPSSQKPTFKRDSPGALSDGEDLPPPKKRKYTMEQGESSAQDTKTPIIDLTSDT